MLKILKNTKKALKNCLRLQIFPKVVKFRQIWSHCLCQEMQHSSKLSFNYFRNLFWRNENSKVNFVSSRSFSVNRTSVFSTYLLLSSFVEAKRNTCGQSCKASTIVNYESRVVLARKLSRGRLLTRNLRLQQLCKFGH